MPLPPSFLEDIRNRLPVSEVVGKAVRLTRAGREFKACCPFHNEKTPSFYVNDDKQFYHCFGCGAHGDVIGFVMKQGGLTFPEAIESLAAQAGLSVPQSDPKEREVYDRQKSWSQLIERAARFFQQQLRTGPGRAGLDYFHNRGLDDDAIERFRLGYAPQDAQALIVALKREGFSEADMLELGLIKKSENSEGYYSFFRNRVIFPVGDRRGNIVAFGARLLAGEGPKYINSPDHPLFHKGKLLFGLSRARAAVQQKQPLIVAEGYMDVIALAEAGYIGAVAPLGTAMTEDQMLALWKLLPKPEDRQPDYDYSPILCFDGDNAGQKAAGRALERALPLISAAQTLRIAFMPLGEDPDSLLRRSGKLALQNILDQARPLIDVIWHQALEGRRLQTPEDKAMLKTVLRQYIGMVGDESLRRLYEKDIQDRLSHLFGYKNYQKQGAGQTSAFTRNKPETGFIARRLPPKPNERWERIILATLINHPDLMEEFGEDLARHPFSRSDYRDISAHMDRIFAEFNHEPLDAAQFYGHFSQAIKSAPDAERLQVGLSELLSETTYIHAEFARPEQGSETARNGLRETWSHIHAKQTDSDIEAARLRFNADPSEENEQRLFAIVNAQQTWQKADDE
ncbi:MAG: DNA primase [Alphaproteobacteria bacterium]